MTYTYRVRMSLRVPFHGPARDVWRVERQRGVGGWVAYCWTDNQEDAEHIARVLQAEEGA